MSILDTISKPAERPVICTLLGDAGLGKTSTAATFPKPIFIRAEDGLQAVEESERPDAFPVIDKVDQLWDQLKALIKEEHEYKTLVIDSVTALERIFIAHVIDTDPKNPKSIAQAQGGYGSGPQAVRSLHHRVRKACGFLNEKKGMHVVFIAHAETETIELPDQDAYTRYNLRLGKKSQAPYTDDSDIVGFIKLKMFTRGDKDSIKKVSSTGERLIDCTTTASNVSKNRYGIETALPLEKGINPFVGIVPSLTNQ